jgi:regulatory protein
LASLATKESRSPRNIALNRESIEAKALAYLDKFDATASRLRQVLSDFVKRRAKQLDIDPSAHLLTVNDTVVRYQQSGLINDRRFGVTMARNLVERGASRQAIRTKLYGRGIAADVVDEIIRDLGANEGSELAAARALVRKRKMGNYRAKEERHDSYRRDLGVLARAGFDFDTSKRALSVEGAAEDEGF